MKFAKLLLGAAMVCSALTWAAPAASADGSPLTIRVAGRGDGYCLDNFASGGGQNNSPVGLWACTGGATQLWRLREFNAGATYNYELVNNASGRCLDYPASAGENPGAQFNVYDCLNGASNGQNLARRRLSDGTDALISPKGPGNLAVDAYASSWVGNGSPVGLWEYWGDPGNKLQHWY